MYIHYFIILHAIIVVFTSATNRSILTNLHTHTRLYYRKNRTTNLMESSLVNNRSTYKPNLSSTNMNRIVDSLRKHENANHTRIRRDFLRENTINDEDNVNIYGDNDGRYFRNQQEAIDGEYYLPIKKKFKMSKLLEIK